MDQPSDDTTCVDRCHHPDCACRVRFIAGCSLPLARPPHAGQGAGAIPDGTRQKTVADDSPVCNATFREENPERSSDMPD
jgi:hypothetical protein